MATSSNNLSVCKEPEELNPCNLKGIQYFNTLISDIKTGTTSPIKFKNFDIQTGTKLFQNS